MKLLLDTHAFLWFISGDAALSANGRALIEDKLVSIGSLCETAITNRNANCRWKNHCNVWRRTCRS